MRLDIRYRMDFAYDLPVWESQNEIRVRPRDDDRQRVIAYRLTPAPTARVLSFVDYWGTTVDHVGIRQPHATFQLIAEAAVETSAPTQLERDPPLADLADSGFVHEMSEYLAPSPHVEWTEEIRDVTLAATRSVDTVMMTAAIVVDLVNDRIAYTRGSTQIGISLAELMKLSKGVCQDYAHLTIGMLRSIGIPARYVSGYLFASDETAIGDDETDPVTVQTHAWIEVAVPHQGWFAMDPTNRRPVGVRHVVIGHGRDYEDVAPVRGVFLGSGTPTVQAEVEIRRMQPAQRSTIGDRPRRLNTQQLEDHRRQMQQQQQQ